ncbi:FabD/lysophospholipase-like protein, partial [Lindgomyces ingoldianus]
PSVVVGHSSGEIAAAYCAGHLDHASAMKASYYRGLLSSSLEDDASDSHSMAAVGLLVDDTRAEIAEFEEAQKDGSLGSFTVSCINSPRSVTISGPVDALREFTKYLAAKSIFSRLLKVKVGYHSSQMSRIASQYADLMGVLRPDSSLRNITMVSSVTGAVIRQHHVCHPDYWVRNMISTVNFLAAIQWRREEPGRQSCRTNSFVDAWLEIGPHSTLQVPLKQIVHSKEPQAPIVYTSALVQKLSAISSLLNAIGWL